MSTEHREFTEYAAAAPELEREASGLVPTVIRFIGTKGPGEYAGFLVPNTRGFFAIDERWASIGFEDAEWAVTHLPTGARVDRTQFPLPTADKAVQFAQNLFREMLAIGCDLNSADRKVAAAPVTALTDEERKAFWVRVAP